MSVLDDVDRKSLACDFLVHESKKRNLYEADLVELATVLSSEHADALRAFREVCPFPSDASVVRKELIGYTTQQLWRLFHAVSCGVLRKGLYNCVCYPGLSWKLALSALRSLCSRHQSAH